MREVARGAGGASELTKVLGELSDLRGQVAGLKRVVEELANLGGPFGTQMPGGRMLVHSIHHIAYLIDPADLIMAPQLIIYRQWERELSALFRRAVGPDSVVVDVGANFGYFTCLAGATIGPRGSGRLFAIEPNPRLVELLRANIQINWSMCPIEVFPLAAGWRRGQAPLSVPRDRAANASLSASADDSVDVVEVEVAPLDGIVPAGVRVDLLKIDVEGHETGVLLGAERVLAESPEILVVMEWSPGQTLEAGYDPRELAGLIADLGFSILPIGDDGQLDFGSPMSVGQLLDTAYANLALKRL
jgi:FkbM family methyltransferase